MKRHKRVRANGEGTLERKPNGVYLARWSMNGHKYSQTTATTIRTEAEKKLKEFVKPFQEKSEKAVIENLQGKIRLHDNLIAEEDLKQPALKISDALAKFFSETALHNHKVSDGTMKVYSHQFTRFERFVKKYHKVKISELREVTPQMVKDFLVPLQKELCPSTYNSYLKLMKFIWRTLWTEAKLTCNPWEEYSTLDLETHSRRNLTIEEIKKVMTILDGEWKILFSIGLFSGLRLVDASHLKWSSIDFMMNRMNVVIQKTKRKNPLPIPIPLHKDLLAVLSAVPKEERKGFVIPNCARLYDCGSINYRIKKIFEDCGIETMQESASGRRVNYVGYHVLRQMFVTTAAEAGIPFPIIQAIVGHASTRMTEHYFKTSKDSLNQCVNAIPSYLSEDVKTKTSVMMDAEVVELIKNHSVGAETLDECIRRLIGIAEGKTQNQMKPFVAPIARGVRNDSFWSSAMKGGLIREVS